MKNTNTFELHVGYTIRIISPTGIGYVKELHIYPDVDSTISVVEELIQKIKSYFLSTYLIHVVDSETGEVVKEFSSPPQPEIDSDPTGAGDPAGAEVHV